MLGGGQIEIGHNFTSLTITKSDSFETFPYEIKDGRIYFTLGGSNKDITAYINYEAFYEYEWIGENGFRHVIIVGGAPNEIGWAEFVWDANGYQLATTSIHGGDTTPAWLNNARVAHGLGVWSD